MKYRSRTEIATAILESAVGGNTKTKIMYRAFLSYAQLKEYLAVLEENGLLSYDKSSHVYKTTQKGMQFLKVSSSLQVLSEGMLQGAAKEAA